MQQTASVVRLPWQSSYRDVSLASGGKLRGGYLGTGATVYSTRTDQFRASADVLSQSVFSELPVFGRALSGLMLQRAKSNEACGSWPAAADPVLAPGRCREQTQCHPRPAAPPRWTPWARLLGQAQGSSRFAIAHQGVEAAQNGPVQH
jgi:hypothetical protein